MLSDDLSHKRKDTTIFTRCEYQTVRRLIKTTSLYSTLVRDDGGQFITRAAGVLGFNNRKSSKWQWSTSNDFFNYLSAFGNKEALVSEEKDTVRSLKQ